MSSVTGTSSTSTSRSSSNGLSGLVSGMDTESMVKKMLTGTQSKIDKQIQSRQRLTWRQDIYRDITTSLNSFKSKYLTFSSTSKVNMNSDTFFNSSTATASSSAVKATALTNSKAGKVTIDSITKLATSRTEKSGQTVTAALTGGLDLESLKRQELTLQIGDVKKSFDISGFTKDNIISGLNGLFSDETNGFGANKVSAEFNSAGQLIIKRLDTTDTDKNLTVGGSDKAMNILGLTPGVKPNGSAVGSVDYTKADTPVFINVTLDGVTKKINLDLSAATDEDFATSLNTSIQNAFGSGIKVEYDSGTDKISFKTTKMVDGSAVVEDTPSRQITISGSDATAGAFGLLNGQSNKINGSMALSKIKFTNATLTADTTEGSTEDFKFTINGVEFTGKVSDSLNTIVNKINLSNAGVKINYSSLEDKFIVTSTESGAGRTINMSDTKGDFLKALFGTSRETISEGQNAKLKIGGIDVERNSNTFEYDGIKLELQSETTTPVDVSVSRDTDKVVAGIKEFVTDYNALIDKLNGLLSEDNTAKDYDPLTDAQKAEMSEKQIETWEKKAKSGIVHNDNDIRSFISQVRSVMYTKPEGAKYALYDLGITTDTWKNNGKIVMEDPPTKLIAALEENAQEVSKLFTDGSEGLSNKISKIVDTYAKVSVSSPGIFVKMAGATGTTDTSSTIYKQLKDIKTKLKSLDTQYQKEYKRYWGQFNKMESLIAQMNQQSSWLSSQS